MTVMSMLQPSSAAGLADGRQLILGEHDEGGPGLGSLAVEVLAALAEGFHVAVEIGDVGRGESGLDLKCVLEGRGAADARTIGVEFLAPRTHAVNDGDIARLLAGLGLQLAAPQHGFQFEGGNDVGQASVAVLLDAGGIEFLVAGADQHGTGVQLQRFAVFGPDARFEVAVESLEFGQFAVEKNADVGMALDARDPVVEDVLRGVEIGRGQVEAGDVSAEVVLLFDQEDLLAGIGQFKRGGESGDAAAEDQGGRSTWARCGFPGAR